MLVLMENFSDHSADVRIPLTMNTARAGVFQRTVTFFQVVLAKPSTLSTREWDGLGVVFTLLILCATTMPWTNFTGQPYWRKVIWLPFADLCWQGWFLSDVVENVVMFVPLGWCMVLAQRSQPQSCLTRVLMLALALSLSGEFFQVFSLQRSPSMTDVCTNTVGTLLAALLAIDCQAQERRSRLYSKAIIVSDSFQSITVPVTRPVLRNAECGLRIGKA
jgi:glycopeptide antibiotics resistance protein